MPAIISYPKQLPVATVRDQAITACDWYPTVLDLCKVELPKVTLDGASLLPIILDDAPTHHKVLYWQWQSRWVVREGDWKLLGNRDKPSQLINLADEQPERKNYIKEKAELVERLLALHVKWREEVTPKD